MFRRGEPLALMPLTYWVTRRLEDAKTPTQSSSVLGFF